MNINTVINAFNADHLDENVRTFTGRFPFLRHFVWNNLDPSMGRAETNRDTAHRLRDFEVSLNRAMRFLAQSGLPTILAWPIILAEVTGGIALIVGFHGRIVSLVLLPILLGAISIHAPNGWVFTSANGGWEYPVFLIIASLVSVRRS